MISSVSTIKNVCIEKKSLLSAEDRESVLAMVKKTSFLVDRKNAALNLYAFLLVFFTLYRIVQYMTSVARYRDYLHIAPCIKGGNTINRGLI